MKSFQNITIVLGAALLGGCLASTPPSEDPVLLKLEELERRLAGIERVVNNQSLVNLTQQVNAIERQGDEIRGQIEELSYEASTTSDRQRQLYVDLDARIQELEAAVSARNNRSVLDGGTLTPGELPVPGGSDRDNYQAAFELLKSERYDAAAMAFEQFLIAYPESELADNAQYWLAESHYVTQQFEKALSQFEVVIQAFPDSRKVPDALLKIGYCNYELKRWDAAKGSLARVQADYPETTAAMLAGQRLQRMEEEGV